MAALDKVRPKKSRQSRVTPFKVATATEIFGGGIVLVNATGFAVPAEAGVAGVVAGIADESVDNPGADGAKTVLVRGSVEYEEFLFANDSVAAVAQTHVTNDCFVLDDQTVTSDDNTGANMVAGTVIEVTTAGVWVRFKL
jgi:hypothetical protein